MKHLTPDTLEALLDGSLAAGPAAELRRHLEQDCPRCEALLEESGPELDTLLRLLEAQQGSDPEADGLSEEERAHSWASIEAGLGAETRRPATRPWWRLPSGAAVALAALAAVLLFFLRPPPSGYLGVKGDGVPGAAAVTLRVVAGSQDGEGFQLRGRVRDGEQLGRELSLLFELETDRQAARYLFVLDGAGQVTQLAPAPGTVAEVETAGSRRVGSESGWAVLDLDDMRGPLTLVGAASTLPMDPLIDMLRPWQAGAPVEGASFDTLTVELEP